MSETVIVSKVGVSVTAQLAGLREELGKIPGITSEMATAMTAQLNKSVNAAEAANIRAAKAANATIAQSSRETVDSVKATSSAASVAVQASMAAAAATTTRSAGQMAQASRMVTSNLINIGNSAIATRGNLISMSAAVPDVLVGLSQMGVSAGTVLTGVAGLGAAVAVTYGAWRLYTASVSEATASQDAMNRSANVGQTAMERIRDRIIDLRVKMGTLRQEDVDAAKAKDELARAFETETKALKDRGNTLNAMKFRTVSENVELGKIIETVVRKKELYEQEKKLIEFAPRVEQQLRDEAELHAGAGKSARSHRAALDDLNKIMDAARKAGEALVAMNLRERQDPSAAGEKRRESLRQLEEWTDALRGGNLLLEYSNAIRTRATAIATEYADSLNKIASGEREAGAKKAWEGMEKYETTLLDFFARRAELIGNERAAVAGLDVERIKAIREYAVLVDDVASSNEEYAERLGEGIALINRQTLMKQKALILQANTDMIRSFSSSVTDIAGVVQQGLAVVQTAVDAEISRREADLVDYEDRITAFEVAITAATDVEERKRLEIRKNALQKEQDARRKAALNAFRASQALAVAQAVVATFLSVIQSLAQYGFTPIGAAAAIAAGAAGTASVVSIASEPPPSFHTGGMVSDRAMHQDEVMIRATKQEGIVTGAGVSALGGPEGLRALNAGAKAPAQEALYVTVLDGRTFDIQTARSLRRKSGPLASLASKFGSSPGSFNPFLASRGIVS